SKPKAVAAAPRAKLRSRQPTAKTVIEVAKPSPQRQASAQPQSPPESPTPPLLSGAAPTLPAGSFDNRVGSRREARGQNTSRWQPRAIAKSLRIGRCSAPQKSDRPCTCKI